MINFQEIITSIILLVISFTITNILNKVYNDYLFKNSVHWKIKNYYKEELKKMFVISFISFYVVGIFLYSYVTAEDSIIIKKIYLLYINIAIIIVIFFKFSRLFNLKNIEDKKIKKVFCILGYVILFFLYCSVIYFSYIANFIFKNDKNLEENLGIAFAIMILYFIVYCIIIFLFIIQKKIKTNKCIVYYGDNEKVDAYEIRSQGDYLYVHNKEKDKRLVINKSVVKHIEIEKSDEIKAIEEENKRKYNI